MQTSVVLRRLASSWDSLDRRERRQAQRLLQTALRKAAPPAGAAFRVDPGRDFRAWLGEVTPAWDWDWRHLAYVRRQLQRVIAREIDRLAVLCPPRHGKSEQVTVRWPAFLLEQDPALRFIIGAHTNRLATKFSRKTRGIVRRRGIALNRGTQAADDWETAEGGGVRAVGVGAAPAGVGADGIFIDDPIRNRAEANSPAMRDRTWDWYKDDLITRLEPVWSFVILQVTRWHVDDLWGRIEASDEAKDWTLIELPALAVAGKPDPWGRKPLEALEPRRYTQKQLLRIKRILGRSFEALYQQNPTALEGNIVQRSWIRYYPWERPPGAEERVLRVQSWDTAGSDREIATAASVCTTWDCTRTGYYLRDEWRDFVGYPMLRQAAERQAAE